MERDLSCAQNVLSSVHYLSEKSLLLIPVVCQIKISVGNKNQSDMIKFHSAFGKVLHGKIAKLANYKIYVFAVFVIYMYIYMYVRYFCNLSNTVFQRVFF